MSEPTNKPTVIQQAVKTVSARIDDVNALGASVGWAPLAGCAAIYLAHIRQVEKQAGTAPTKGRKTNRTIGRDYEW